MEVRRFDDAFQRQQARLAETHSATAETQQQDGEGRQMGIMTDQQTVVAGPAQHMRRPPGVVLRFQPLQHPERELRPGGQPQELRRTHRTHQRTVLDDPDGTKRHPPLPLGKLQRLALTAGGEIPEPVRFTGLGFGMTEKKSTHAPSMPGVYIYANRSCPCGKVDDECLVRPLVIALLLLVLTDQGAAAVTTNYSPVGMTYDGVLCLDAATGAVLVEKMADVRGHPASVTKLMTTLLVFEDIRSGKLALTSRVTVTKAAASVGGSQVWLAPGENFSVEELLYALMLQSANDVAVALAIDRAGSVPAFVARMNQRAAELGMTRTTFVTPNGLTAGRGPHDTTSARDLGKLCLALAKFPEVFRFTGTKEYTFRRPLKSLQLVNHNHLLAGYPGCDGFKTGWTVAAKASIITTARSEDMRVIAIVLGCDSPIGAKAAQRLRDKLAADLMDEGFAKLKVLNAEKARRQASATPPTTANRDRSQMASGKTTTPVKEPGFLDWLSDLFSF